MTGVSAVVVSRRQKLWFLNMRNGKRFYWEPVVFGPTPEARERTTPDGSGMDTLRHIRMIR